MPGRSDGLHSGEAAQGGGAGPKGSASSSTTERVTSPSSGLVFINKYGSGVSSAFHDCIIAAEHFFQSEFTNSCTLHVSFNLKSLDPGFSAYNNFNLVHVSYAQLKTALLAHDTTSADQIAAADALPAADPSHGAGFNLPADYADMLGLSSVTGRDAVVLNSNLDWSWGQDAISAIEHEMSEGAMGRIGGLGVQNKSWSTMDLFRFTASGTRDYTGGRDGLPTYFSTDGSLIGLQFHNSINQAGVFDGDDVADWDDSVIGDTFGDGGPGSPGSISQTDLQVMNALGWTLSDDSTGLVVSSALTLKGGGRLTLMDDGYAVHTAGSAATLTNAGKTIAGVGLIGGDDLLTFVNEKGVVAANIKDDAHGLVIDTLDFTNAGTLEAKKQGVLVIGSDIENSSTGHVKATSPGSHVDLEGVTITGGKVSTAPGSIVESVDSDHPSTISQAVVKNAGTLGAEGGDLTINGDVTNLGTLDANDHQLTVVGDVTGRGHASIEGSGVLEFGGASSAKVAFAPGAAGTLILDAATNDSFVFKEAIKGFAANDHIDLGAIDFTTGDAQLSYSANHSGTGGVLTVSDGTHTESLVLKGSYQAADFHISDNLGHVDLWM